MGGARGARHGPILVGASTLLVLTAVVLSSFVSIARSSAASMSQKRLAIRRHLKHLNSQPPDGDIIDCVHLHHQPAFDHPFLKNQTIQMRPAFFPEGMYEETRAKASSSQRVSIAQPWHLNGRCPENTIPIRRTRRDDLLRKHRSIPKPTSADPDLVNESGHQHAIAYVEGDKYYGAKATINVWNPKIQQVNEFSLSQLWILGGSFGEDLNSIEAGWQVSPDLYGDNNTGSSPTGRDAYQATGCYNLLCSGFIQVNGEIAMGPASSPSPPTTDPQEGNWWMQFGSDYVLGYCPPSSSPTSRRVLPWWSGEGGGELGAKRRAHRHSDGLRPLPGGGLRKGELLQECAGRVGTFTEQSNCYDVQSGYNGDWGSYFYFGGPGKSANCH
ncbi:unnamed protein product [Spirodela intermedia]|uniref:Neprosin PEP catalytic domain-containing protein n=1 Tax=Spirodela intermedia TaxID=51605 RepID=A0A7I8IXZ4_SPIIN|nr:unnamed protein product [Spirodela intermedia]CAA6662875.1 unnamed protein product [Spirodela intermedia]